MKEQTEAYLEKAEAALSDAVRVLRADVHLQAARLAYFAAFHAAQALIFERTAKAAKTHKGANAQFAKIVLDEGLAPDLSRFLSIAYHFKTAADYETGEGSIVKREDALKAIENAETFVSTVATHLNR
jgi:uncharacterized protein (UPF0332 family)